MCKDFTTHTAPAKDEEDEWLDARYEAALDQVGGDKATHLDPVTIFMIGAKWDRQYGSAATTTHTADDMDGGVTAALIEKEAEESPSVDYEAMWWDAERRAKQAEKERDEALRALGEALESHDETLRDIASGKYADEPRPLTPRQNLAALWESAHRPVGGRIPAGTAIITRSDYGSGDVRYQTLEATGRDLPDEGRTLERNYPFGPEGGEEYRLLDPPARSEGAEDVAVRLFQAGAAVGVEMTAEQRDALADHLAAMHVRVVGEERS